jgi:D-aminoacyl-tRNA deacylase
MMALVQRVSEASVEVEGRSVGRIGRGLLILLGVHRNDTGEEAAWAARKCAALRIFPDEEGRMNHSITEIAGEALVVSQFTLYGDTAKGNRPSFTESAPPEQAERLYEAFVQMLGTQLGNTVQTGVFGAVMHVRLINDGPVTFIVEKKR